MPNIIPVRIKQLSTSPKETYLSVLLMNGDYKDFNTAKKIQSYFPEERALPKTGPVIMVFDSVPKGMEKSYIGYFTGEWDNISFRPMGNGLTIE